MSEPLHGLLHLVRRHPAGTVLFREGDPGEKMFLIRAGKANIVKRISDSEITLAVLGPGEFFGEMAQRFEYA
jgi:CRP/FNR family cyclic AMP-dependent transcriptional regulator